MNGKSPSGRRKCKVCTDFGDCSERPQWLYVAVDHDLGLVKIGMTVNPASRQATYRGPGSQRNIEIVHRSRFDCWYRTSTLEERALRRLEKSAKRINGDWFQGEVADAIAAVEAQHG